MPLHQKPGSHSKQLVGFPGVCMRYSLSEAHDLVLATHMSLFAEPAGENLPGGHALQLPALTPPESARYVSALHSTHADKPSTSAKLPGTHGSHANWPVNRAILPRSQAAHVLALVAPTLALAFPSGHGTHAYSRLSPSTSWYVPAAHLVQLTASVAPASRPTEPRGQGRQLVARVVLTYVPAVQADLATPLHHEPAGQSVQLARSSAFAM